MVSLAELSGKLGQFIGPEKAVTTAIKDCIDAIINSNEDFKSLKKSPSPPAQPSTAVSAELINEKMLDEKIEHYNNLKTSLESKKTDKNPPLSSEDSRLLSSHQSKLQSLEKLNELNDSLNSLSNNNDDACKNLLDNLCTGLEKFLGYHDGNYTGEGIVYSDLDRLCDGVMAFLHGVFETVKDDENITTYDKDVLKIGTVISSLDTSVGKGREAFVTAVRQVDKATGAVTAELGENNNEYYKSVQDQLGATLQVQLTRWTDTVEKIQKEVQRIETDHVKPLDNSLKSQITHEINVIHKSVKMLRDSAEVPGLRQQVVAVETELDKQKKQLQERIKSENEKLQKILFAQFANILMKIGDLNNEKKEHVMSLRGVIEIAKKKVHSELSETIGTTRINVSEKFESIKTSLMRLDPKGGDGINSLLRRDVMGIRRDLISINDDIHGCVKSLGEWIEEATRVLDDAINSALFIMEKKPGEENMFSVKRNALALKAKGEELYWHYDWAKRRVTELVREVQTKIGALYGAVNGGQGSGDNNKISEVLKKIKQDVDGIKGQNGGTDGNGLDGIKHKVHEYAQTFATNGVKNAFEEKVQGWVDGILKNEVKGAIGWYVSANKSNGTLREKYAYKDGSAKYEELNKKIAEHVVTKFNGMIPVVGGAVTSKIATVVSSPNEAIKIHVEAVRYACNQLVGAIAGTIAASTMATAIGEEVWKVNDGARLDKSYLQSAIEDIKKTLADRAREVGNGFAWFIDNDKEDLTNKVDAVSKITDDLEKRLNAATQASGGSNHAQAVDDAITKIDTEVAAAFDNNVKNIYVKSPPVPVPTVGKEDKGVLHQSYEDITDNLEQLTEEFSKTGNAVKDELMKLKNKNIAVLLRQIKELIESVRYNNVNGVTAEVQGALAQIHELEAVPGQVEEKRKEVEKIMDKLKSGIENEIHLIEAAVNNADSALTYAIEALKNAHTTAYDICKQAVDQLSANLKDAVNLAFYKVTNAVQEMFVEQHKADLDALKKLVEDAKNKIGDIISLDSMTGLKGLIREMKAQLEGRSLIHIQSPVEFTGTASDLKTFLDALLKYVEGQLKTVVPPQPPTRRQPPASTPDDGKVNRHLPPRSSRSNLEYHGPTLKSNTQSSQVSVLATTLEHLWYLLNDSRRFDIRFEHHLTKVKDALGRLNPKTFSGFNNPVLLDVVRNSVAPLVAELGRAYMNSYESAHPIEWERDTVNAERCSKVCLTILFSLHNSLRTLRRNCKYGWDTHQINTSTALGTFMADQGYEVSEKGKQNGHLRNKTEFKGENIHSVLVGDEVYNVFRENGKRPLDFLYDYLQDYNALCHYRHVTQPRVPCSVYEMLVWLGGLPHNRVYNKLADQCKTLLQNEDYIDVASNFTNISKLHLPKLCSYSYDILTKVLGHGDEYTTYGCDYPNNSHSLKYPTSGEECLGMLLDILHRLFPPLMFLLSQCSNVASEHGWHDCFYGKDVPPSNWPCNDHTATASNCLPRSPLQSYLTDALPGHLPHQLTSVGCKSTCNTCPKSTPGMPCLTPLGFRGFSGSKRSGKELCNVLTKLLTNKLVSLLFCVLPKAPRTLPEHIVFARCLVNEWHDGNPQDKNGLQRGFEKSVTEASIRLYENTGNLAKVFIDAYGSESVKHPECQHPHLLNITSDGICKNTKNKIECAPYLSSLYSHAYPYFTKKHSNTYLSWAIYLPWTFWDLLNNLYNAFCGITCADWGCRGCLRGDKCKNGKHGVIEDEKKTDETCQCTSIVACRGVAPTLYQYGFSFGEASTLNDGKTPKKCKDFCSQLKNVLKSEYFQALFKECDNFLKEIRWPFMLTLLALWSLSLLYLLHIAVVRLDVLRIRYHLRSPSSHRIAAQSLLAAARVKALANVKYFSP
ncbi:hypothetical protein, conserved [Babesia ovata]|uniref:C3H1-type domain-containing protein n=1 Tax=Babesia ovata TaxID=189622 RepID=A0A2H6KJ54_9APIC|nr:uncharacterized protein BOVATA_045180 [Babesia ovata]GBE63025.1 hypothetical protein, conserved [Babesia ovata]